MGGEEPDGARPTTAPGGLAGSSSMGRSLSFASGLRASGAAGGLKFGGGGAGVGGNQTRGNNGTTLRSILSVRGGPSPSSTLGGTRRLPVPSDGAHPMPGVAAA